MARHYKKTANTLITVIKTAVLLFACAAVLAAVHSSYPSLLPDPVSKHIESTKNYILETKEKLSGNN